MTPEERKNIRMSATMDGDRVIVKNIGRMVKLSELELMLLANFAHIGQFFLFSQLDGEQGIEAEKQLQDIIDAIRQEFSSDGTTNGLNRSTQSITAMLSGQRFGEYLVWSKP